MEAKTVTTKKETNSGYWLRRLFSGAVLLFISGIIKAADTVSAKILTPDSLANDTAKGGIKVAGHGWEDNPIITYSLMAIGIIVIIGFAYISSVKNSKPKPGAPVGYRKPPTPHKHNHKI